MMRKALTTTHPHGYMLTQNECKFGFIRISKNGSTAISHVPEFKLKKWCPIQGFKGNVYAALRDPVDRFFSSIPETLMRYRHPDVSVSKNTKSQDINVSYDVYDFLLRVKSNKLDQFLLQYIEFIKGCGYFDAHHEPQVNFITDLNGDLYNDIFLFDIDQSNNALTTIGKMEGLCNNIKAKIMNDGSGNLMQKYNSKKILFNILRMGNGTHKNEYMYNPMYRWALANNIPTSHARVEFYKRIKELRFNRFICSKIETLYENDIYLFDKVMQKNKDFENLFFLSKK